MYNRSQDIKIHRKLRWVSLHNYEHREMIGLIQHSEGGCDKQ
jgi:hypothetical protein